MAISAISFVVNNVISILIGLSTCALANSDHVSRGRGSLKVLSLSLSVFSKVRLTDMGQVSLADMEILQHKLQNLSHVARNCEVGDGGK